MVSLHLRIWLVIWIGGLLSGLYIYIDLNFNMIFSLFLFLFILLLKLYVILIFTISTSNFLITNLIIRSKIRKIVLKISGAPDYKNNKQ